MEKILVDFECGMDACSYLKKIRRKELIVENCIYDLDNFFLTIKVLSIFGVLNLLFRGLYFLNEGNLKSLRIIISISTKLVV